MNNTTNTARNLQKALEMELAAMHQYQLHAQTLEDWGLDKLAETMRGELQEELGHAGRFIERLSFLKVDPVIRMEGEIRPARDLKSLFASDYEDEKEAVRFYSQSAREAAEEGDVGSRKLFEEIALDEEGHMAWLELQSELLEKMGEGLFISRYMSVDGDED